MEIIATVTNIREEEIGLIEKLCKSSISQYRINCAKFHNADKIFADVNRIRSVSLSSKIMLDVPFPGAKMRVNANGKISIKKGEIRKLIKSSEKSDNDSICVMDISNNIHVNDRLWLDVGEGELKVVDIGEEGTAFLEAQTPLTIYHSKALVGNCVIKSDYDFMENIINISPYAVAFSFVEDIPDILLQIECLKKHGIEVIAKIETQKGVNNIQDILKYVDGIMIARGDLALNVDMKDFIEIQSELSKKAFQNKKKCMIATGIGDSLVDGGFPSRADLSDFAIIKQLNPNAIVLNRPLVMGGQIEKILDTIHYLLD